jgi:transposase
MAGVHAPLSMGKLDDVDQGTLQEALSAAETPKAVKRLVVALCYKDGESVDALAARFDIPRSTIYYWLDRFESEPVAEAIVDEPRPGRPPKLDDGEWEAIRADIRDDPTEYGVDEWTPKAVRDYIEREFGVSYSEGHVRRLLREGTL